MKVIAVKVIALLVNLAGPEVGQLKVVASELPFNPFIPRSAWVLEQAAKETGRLVTTPTVLPPIVCKGFKVIEQMTIVPKSSVGSLFSSSSALSVTQVSKQQEALVLQQRRIGSVVPMRLIKKSDQSLLDVFLKNNREELLKLCPMQPAICQDASAKDVVQPEALEVICGHPEQEMVRHFFLYRGDEEQPSLVISCYGSGRMSIFAPVDAWPLRGSTSSRDSETQTVKSIQDSALQVSPEKCDVGTQKSLSEKPGIAREKTIMVDESTQIIPWQRQDVGLQTDPVRVKGDIKTACTPSAAGAWCSPLKAGVSCLILVQLIMAWEVFVLWANNHLEYFNTGPVCY